MKKREKISLLSRGMFVMYFVGATFLTVIAIGFLLFEIFLEGEILWTVLTALCIVFLAYVIMLLVVRPFIKKIIIDYENNEIIIRKGLFAAAF